MADKKKRMCPNIVKVKNAKGDLEPKCGKEFEFDPEEWNGRCPHCGFNVVRYDDNRALAEVEKAELEAAKPPEKKKKGVLSNLARD